MAYTAPSSSSDSEAENDLQQPRFHVPMLDDDFGDQLFLYEPQPGALFNRYRRRRDVSDVETEPRAHQEPVLRCRCNNCEEWHDMHACEKRCCLDIYQVQDIMAEVNMQGSCFLEQPDFEIICRNPTVRRITRATFDRREQRTYYQALPQHKRDRYITYCNMARWIYGWMGVGNRAPLAACIVKKI